MAEENRTRYCCSRDCYYLIDNGTRCQYGKNISIDDREECERCEGYSTTTAEMWGICSKGLYIECEDYFNNEDENYDEDEEDEEE